MPATTRQPATGTCSLTVRINRVEYRARKIRRDADILGGWKLTKADGTAYRVVKDRWGVIKCNCPDAHRRPEAGCKHARSLQALGLIAPQYRARNKSADPIAMIDAVV